MDTPCETTDLLVFSHIRWNFVFQRPHHLLTRHALHRRVFYFEEPILGMTEFPRLYIRETSENVLVVVPYLPLNIEASKIESVMADLVDELVFEEELIDYSVWYYTPTALAFSRHLEPRIIVFDYMDELALLKGDPQYLAKMESELMMCADVVFIGGHALYENKKNSHHNIHVFPSSIDLNHFAKARQKLVEPDDQVNIPHPRIGFHGVIDERFNFELLSEVADLKTDYHFVIVGPVVNIDPRLIPTKHNIHFLGKKEYHTLPLYLAGWDCAIMPFANNQYTKFLSPTKTLEFLAAGKPVVCTSIKDVVHPYGTLKLVHIADKPLLFSRAIEQAMVTKNDPEWLDSVDHILRNNSWESTFMKMAAIEKVLSRPKSITERSRIIRPLSLSLNGANL